MSLLRTMLAIAAALIGQTLLLTSDSGAQRRYDDRYDRGYERRSQQTQRNVAGQFDYYALVLSWSPTHCASANSPRDDLQCNRRDGRRYNFVLHGLWPQYERGFPSDCPTRDRPFVPNDVIGQMLDIMPAKGLIIHEYRKHGTCSGLEPAGYFDLARQLFNRIRIPERYINPFEPQFVAPEDMMREMIAANPDLKPDMMAVACGGPGNRLKEIRICYTRSGQLRSCGRNENQRRMCSARQMYVPPVRSTAKTPRTSGDRDTGGNRDAGGAPRGEHRGGPKQPGPTSYYLHGPRI